MQHLVRATRGFSRALTWFAGVLLIGSAFLVTGDVIARKLFNASIGGADELSGYAFCAGTALALSFALFERAHIRVDFLYHLFPRRMQRATDILGLILMLGFALVVTAMIYNLVLDTIEHGSRSITPLRTPLIIPQAVWLFGWVFFCFSGVVLLIATIVQTLQQTADDSSDLAGIKTLDEQIDEEAPDARAERSVTQQAIGSDK